MDESHEASSIDGSEDDGGGSSPEIWSEEAGHGRLKLQGKQDRISALPDSLIQLIISFLPSTKEAIRTGILSKRWYDQWSGVPILIFDSDDTRDFTFSEFIDRTLIMLNCPKLKKFQLQCYYGLLDWPKLIPIIRFAVRKHVEELMLHPCPRDYEHGVYILPEFLSSNDALVKLDLFKCYFDHLVRPNWPHLKELKLNCADYLCGVRAIENVLSGCPILESLELADIYFCESDVIASESLKRLVLIGVRFDEAHDCMEILCPNLEELSIESCCHTNLEFSTLPNQKIENILSKCPLLHTLKLEDVNYSERLLIASNSLKKLYIRELPGTLDIELACPNLVEANLYDFKPPNNAYENLGIKMLGQLQHVKFLQIGISMMKNLTALEVADRSSLVLYCTCLTLDCSSFNDVLPGIIRAIRSSPMLEKLSVMFPRLGDHIDLDDCITNYWKSKPAFFSFSMSNLKTVKLDGLMENNENQKLVFNFVECLLKNSPVLENMVVVLSAFDGTGFLVEVSKKLLGFQRCYPHTNIESCRSPHYVEDV